MPPSSGSALIMGVACCSETLVSTYLTIRCYNPDDHNVNTHRLQKPNFLIFFSLIHLGFGKNVTSNVLERCRGLLHGNVETLWKAKTVGLSGEIQTVNP
jgi:hypothetical protein